MIVNSGRDVNTFSDYPRLLVSDKARRAARIAKRAFADAYPEFNQ